MRCSGAELVSEFGVRHHRDTEGTERNAHVFSVPSVSLWCLTPNSWR